MRPGRFPPLEEDFVDFEQHLAYLERRLRDLKGSMRDARRRRDLAFGDQDEVRLAESLLRDTCRALYCHRMIEVQHLRLIGMAGAARRLGQGALMRFEMEQDARSERLRRDAEREAGGTLGDDGAAPGPSRG